MAKNELAQVVEVLEPRMREIIPRGVEYQRLASVVLSEVQANPKLAQCSKTSFATALMECARLGLEPGGAKGLVYLIPRGGNVTVQIGYKGLIELAMRSGKIARLNARVFYKEEIDAGLFKATHEPPSILHDMAIGIDTTTVAGSYAVAELTDGRFVQMILTKSDLDKRRARAMGGGKSGPWKDDYAAMARKSALRALFSSGLIPLSDEMVAGLINGPELQTAQATVLADEPLTIDVVDDAGRALNAIKTG